VSNSARPEGSRWHTAPESAFPETLPDGRDDLMVGSIAVPAQESTGWSDIRPVDRSADSTWPTRDVLWGSLLAIWGCGTAAFVAICVRRSWKLFCALRWPVSVDSATTAVADEMASNLGMRRRPSTRVVDARFAPCLWSWPTPTILLPRQLISQLDHAELRAIMGHELAHHVRRDHWANAFAVFVKALFWWDPVAWWAHRRIRAAQDLCCDALAIGQGGVERQVYAATVLKVLDFVQAEGLSRVEPALGFAFTHSVQERFKMIADTQLKHRMSGWGWASALAVAVVLVCVPARRMAESGENEAAQPTSVARDTLRYDDKEFGWWRHRLRTELKPELRAEAINAMGAFGANGYGEEAVLAILEIVKDYDARSGEPVSNSAMRAFRVIGASAEKPLITALTSGNTNTRRYAVRALASGAGSQGALAALMAATEDSDLHVRRVAVEKLLPQQGAAVAPMLVRALSDQDVETRHFVIQALGQIGPAGKDAVPQLVSAANDANHFVRDAALTALERIGAEPIHVLALLTRALRDDSRNVRQTAIQFLGKLGPAAVEAVPALIDAYHRVDSGDRFLVLDALGQIGPTASPALPLITAALHDENQTVRRSAEAALKKIAGPRGEKPIR
jgi:beta-lactamase regulating signal transducer with metallopeptidase domain/HEAT repeat protein